jgi:hypothetical protein
VIITFCFSMEYGGVIAFVDDLFVRPPFRRAGLATAALAQAANSCNTGISRWCCNGARPKPAFSKGHRPGWVHQCMDELSVGTNTTSSTAGTWQTILSNAIKTPNQKDLFVDVSLEVGLLTDTLVRSKNNVADTSMAAAGVEVRVLIDDREAAWPSTPTPGRW